jgi:hypothetical protein
MGRVPDGAWEIAAIKGSKSRMWRKIQDFSRDWDEVLVSDVPQARDVDWARAGVWDATVERDL